MALSAHWNKHIEAWQGSGLTQAAYCRQHGLNPNSFSSRLHAFRSRDAAKSPTLIPVRIRNQELGTMALQLARGHRLELPAAVSALWLGELLRCLD